MALDQRDGIFRANRLLAAADARRIAESTMALVAALARSRRAAVFVARGATLELFVSGGVDQMMLDTVHRLWTLSRESLASGEPVYLREPDNLLLLPCLAQGDIAGVLCADTPVPGFRLAADHVLTLSGILARTLAQTQDGADQPAPLLESLPSPADVERDRLLIALDRNEWNIARVARILGVTRATIYNRLARFAIERRHVPKVLPRRRLAET